ncbi:hypothetical protein FrCorBMG51_23410 [Protofrankia coriariae]|uniref:Transposase n=1 Tax=Protofrankia coriariae TaxID=1562887 RepID=A0ABR5EYW9_9ACTN|nr:hypothetical protein FrCorBMG51_23410 [Protofrankia coriariae]
MRLCQISDVSPRMLAGRVGSHRLPERRELVDEPPMTATGKRQTAIGKRQRFRPRELARREEATA